MFVALMIYAAVAKPLSGGFGNGIHFTDKNLAEAVKQARIEKKPIFIDLYATWCGPCTMLKVRTFPNKAVGEYFNEHFINMSLDGEKGDGAKLFNAYGFRAFPTLLILDSNGKAVLVTEGFLDPKTLIEFGMAGVAKADSIRASSSNDIK